LESIFLSRPRPIEGECLTSYIQRVADTNFVTSNDIWRLFRTGNAHYPQVSVSYLLDISPELIFDIRRFEKMLLINEYQLDSLTFKNIINKFSTIDISGPKMNILNRFYNKYRKFCPLCLNEALYYKLIWQVQEIIACPIHNISLNYKCINCGHIIPSMPPKGVVGICPYCQHSMVKNNVDRNQKIVDDRIYSDWICLINKDNKVRIQKNDLSFQQLLALKVLYITRHSKNMPNRKAFLNLAKERSIVTIQHSIKMTLNTLRSTNISIESFISCFPTEDFICSVLYRKASAQNKII
jgi:DNA-directed RNA polymerase subunit RPC12/RpoP